MAETNEGSVMSKSIVKSSGNVFADLGLRNADELMVKARVALLIKKLIEDRGLSQTAAAEKMGMAQADISRIIRGQLGGYSLERLLQGVRAFGSKIEIKIKDEKTGRVLMTA